MPRLDGENSLHKSLLVQPPKENVDTLTMEEQKALMECLNMQSNAHVTKMLDKLSAMVTHGDFENKTIQPQPGFVVKTHVIQSDKASQYKVGLAVYINVCHAPEIPEPTLATEPEIQKALQGDPSATFRVPMSIGPARSQDGQQALIFDACIHTRAFVRSERDLDYRLYIIELGMEHVELSLSVELSREFTMPPIACKGTIPQRILRLPKPSLLDQLKKEHVKKPVKVQPSSPWVCHPDMTTLPDGRLQVAVAMPSDHAAEWSVEVAPDQLLLHLAGKTTSIPLHVPVLLDGNHTCQFFKKSRHLVICIQVQ